MSWNPHNLPDQTGRTHVVTGSTAGIGYFAAEQLAAAGAHVVLASRSIAKLDRASEAIRGRVPRAEVTTVELDLASLDSVRAAASALSLRGRIDGLFLNGGAMETSTDRLTADGLPMMLGTHVVANVALVEQLLPMMTGRIVHASTGFVRRLRLDVDDVRAPQRGFFRAYTQAKTVTELYAYELDRRLRADGAPAASIVVHPGVGVDAKTPAREGVYDPRTQRRRNPFTPWAQGKDDAAWSAVRALTDPEAVGGDYFGPANGRRGLPVRLEPLAHTAHADADRVARVWTQLHELAAGRIVPAENASPRNL
jgi:NAD(P)-dependent dehydrogenase (short-subunit alcohol dehydrogenase family)